MRLCFVLLAHPAPLTAKALRQALPEFPELGALTWGGTKRGVTTFSLGTLELTCALLPAPVPDGEADGATDHSLSGLDGSWTLPEHRAHLVVVEPGPTRKSAAQLTRFTRAVAAITRATDALGVYWGDAHATHHPEFVIDLAKGELPLPVWVGVSIATVKGKTELLSLGMGQLGLPDLLLQAASADGPTLGFFYELLAFVARRKKPLPDGDTVGRHEKERLRVTYVASPLHDGEQVWRVTLPAPRRARSDRAPPVKPR